MMLSGSSLHCSTHSDNHVHTRLCGHAQGEMEEYVLSAINRNLKQIVFLEHMEEGILAPKPSWLSENDFDYYFKEGKRLQDRYQEKIKIGLGVECGFNTENKETLLSRLENRKWDQIGISCHFLKIGDDTFHLNLFSKKPENIKRATELGTNSLFSRYLDNLLEAIEILNGSVLCHLDAAFRWVPGHFLTEHHYAQIDALIAKAAKKEMALEINTSGINIRNEPFPNNRILGLAVKHKMVFQLGSDAHKPENVGQHFNLFS